MSLRRPPPVPRLSTKESVVLELLAEHPRMYGLQLVAASEGRLKRGTVYVTLGRMEEKGYVTSHADAVLPEGGGLPRRLYEASAFGLRVWQAWSDMARVLRLEPAR